jgi:hypothetical protein
MKGTPASPATALASSVLPVPGGPHSSTPLGILARSLLYCSALRRQATTSRSSSLADDTPAGSSQGRGRMCGVAQHGRASNTPWQHL